MNKHPFFSIIIPIYKVEKFLKECINSVLEQKCKDFEIILVDDGSPDNCPLMCEEYKKKCDKIIVIHQKNGGLSDARNTGISRINGLWTIFLDSDDKFANENTLLELKEYIQKEDTNIIYCPCLARFSDKITPVFPICDVRKKMTSVELFDFTQSNGSLFAACLFVINSQILREKQLFFTKGILHEDMDWIPRVLSSVNDYIGVFPGKFYLYRINDTSITSSFSQKRFDGLIYTIKWITELDTKNDFLILWLNMLFYSLFINLEAEICDRYLFNLHFSQLKNYMLKVKKNLSKRNRLIIHFGRLTSLVFYKLRGLIK